HVTGAALYTDDLPEPIGCLHAAPVLSPHARASFAAIDPAPALAMKGVRAVLTAADIPGVNDVGPVFAGDPIMSEGEVFYAGQSVALVLADSRTEARAA